MPPVRKQDMHALHCTLVSRMVIIVAGGEDRAWEQQPGPKAPRGVWLSVCAELQQG
jgi:hypothetical protein